MHISRRYNRYSEYLDDINCAVTHEADDFIDACEQSYRKSICDIAQEIVTYGHASLLLLAGPSASGKTTTGLILMEELSKLGIHAKMVSMDDFFYGRGIAPKLPDGRFDYEAIGAMDVDLLQECLLTLINEGECMFPMFDFSVGKPFAEQRHVELHKDELLIVEGIHALNPLISQNLPQDKLLKLYISVKQGVKWQEGTLLSHLDIRLMRRLVRDYKFRNSSSEFTFGLWDQVCVGERTNIQPFKREADIVINSIHMYEPCVIGAQVAPLLEVIKPDSKYYPKAQQLLAHLKLFKPLTEAVVPKNSLLREFLGGSMYHE